jgi:hypothetical protein
MLGMEHKALKARNFGSLVLLQIEEWLIGAYMHKLFWVRGVWQGLWGISQSRSPSIRPQPNDVLTIRTQGT